MSSPLDADGLEQVMRHERGLRRLAAELLADPADVDDAVQHALTQAALGRRRAGTPLLPFLRTVLRRHASNLRKLARRRRSHEADVAARPDPPTPEDFVAREQLRRRVADAVHALPEPYRVTVRLRWFEDLDNEAVALRTGVPVATVRTRLHRAHTMLAERLDREYGSRRAWAPLALPLGGAVGATAVTVASGIAMKKTLLALAVLVPIVFAFSLRPGAVAVPVDTSASEPSLVVASGEAAAGASERQAAAVGKAPAAAPSRLVVRFADGRPAGGLDVWWCADDASRPVWTRRVDPTRDREIAPGAAAEFGVMPPDFAMTDGDGGVLLPAERSEAAVVCVRFAADQCFAAPRPSDGSPFVLPALGEVEVAVRGAPAGSRWSVIATPAVKEPDGGTSGYGGLRQNLDGPTAGVVCRREHEFVVDAADRLRVLVPLGVFATFAIEGHGFEVRIPGGDGPSRTVEAPALVEAGFVRPLAVLRAVVQDDDGREVDVSGRCWLRADRTTGVHVATGPEPDTSWSEQQQSLAAGSVTFDRVPLREGGSYELTILFDDDTWLGRCIRFAPVGGVHRVVFRRDEALRPMIWSLGDLPAETDVSVAIETAEGTLEGVQPRRMLYSATVPMFARRGNRIGLAMMPRDWRAAWIVAANGRVGSVARGADAESVVAWLPSAQPRTVDVAQLYRDHGDRELMAAWLQVELSLSDGKTVWWLVATHRRFHRSEAPPPVWRDLLLPAAARCRLLLHAGDDPETGFGPPVEIPL